MISLWQVIDRLMRAMLNLPRVEERIGRERDECIQDGVDRGGGGRSGGKKQVFTHFKESNRHADLRHRNRRVAR